MDPSREVLREYAVRVHGAPGKADLKRLQSGVPLDDGMAKFERVEAGRGEGFRRYVGREGIIHGMTCFGKSAPYQALEDHFGSTAPKLADAVRQHLKG